MSGKKNQEPPNYEPPGSCEDLLQRYAAGERYFVKAELPDAADLRGINLEDANL